MNRTANYILYDNGRSSGRTVTSQDIQKEWKLDRRNISKYMKPEGRRYLGRYNFVPEHIAAAKAETDSPSHLNSYTVTFKRVSLRHISYGAYKTVQINCTSKEMCEKIFYKHYDRSEYMIVDVAKAADCYKETTACKAATRN